jgi:hypothetical protein
MGRLPRLGYWRECNAILFVIKKIADCYQGFVIDPGSHPTLKTGNDFALSVDEVTDFMGAVTLENE